MVVKVYDLVGEYAMGADRGEKLYEEIYPKLLEGKNISLDFTGIKIFTSSFLSVAIGQLLKDIAREKLYELAEFTGLSQKHQKLIAYVIDNAEHYYSDEEYRNAVNTVMSEKASAL
ncbi:MAG: STAS-like domain-containing protein [Calothrix sp. FI2-JRJ7]|jgi:hypothetical protein|nr:STAS-like domain-containing protein [Calothrix sp. FI2-JRJ7]